MKQPDLFRKTVDILFTAYLNGHLLRGNCCACAVGNLVAGNRGWGVNETLLLWYKDTAEGFERHYPRWNSVFSTCNGKQRVKMAVYRGNKEIREEIFTTGYSLQELMRIEYAFETAKPHPETGNDVVFSGLIAVLDVLFQLHQIEPGKRPRYKNMLEDIYAYTHGRH
jgi:hypothetical protein